MKKRFLKFVMICGQLMLAFVLNLNLSACSNRQENVIGSEKGISIDAPQSEKDYSSKSVGNESSGNHMPDMLNDDTDKNTAETGSVNSSAFSGKVSGLYYANDNMVIVAADKLYLYDMKKGEHIASADISLQELYVQAYPGGYFIVGQETDGSSNGSLTTSQSGSEIKGYLLNKDFDIKDTISFRELLKDDFMLGTEDAAVSQDGKRIAFGGLRGLYLYDTAAKKVSTILNYFEGGTADNMQILTIDSLAFTGDKSLTYVGTGTGSSNGGDGFSIYGTVSIDHAELSITRKAGYEVGEVQKGGDLLFMPQSHNKNNGTLLMLDTASNTEKTMKFSSSREGKDGVFCSRQGKYVATSTLDGSSVTINIYNVASGKVIHTETVKDSNSTYFLRIPQILILDGSNTCIVVLGRGISEVNTLITTFGFEGE